MIGLVFFLILIAMFLYLRAIRKQNAQREEEQRRKREEYQRVKACGEVVLFFANQLGYIARSCISREELAGLIDTGISAPELAGEISRRITEVNGITLGYHPFGEYPLDVKLPKGARERHIYIIGKSGYGKTNLLRTMIIQDLEEGNGIGVIAPEQEMLTEEILPYVPDYRLNDVIYFNPADTEYPVSFNPLHLDEGEDLDLKVDETFTILSRLIEETGPRMAELLRQSLYALTGREGATLADIERLLDRTDPAFRNEVIRASRDPQVIHFWRDVYPTMPKDAHLPITTRLGRFIRPKLIRNVLCNSDQSLNFRRAMDARKILLFNLSDGVLGEQNSQLLGQLVVSKLQLAVMARATQGKHERKPFYLYVDEFQTFTGTSATSYEKILSRARKYRLSLVLAHQQTGQLPSQLLKEILGNVSTTICFQVSREDASKISKEMVTMYDGEVTHIPEEEILRLKVGETWCKIGQHSFFMRTYLADQHPDHRRAERVIRRARQNYQSFIGAATYQRAASPDPTFTTGADSLSDRTVKQEPVMYYSAEDLLKDIDPANIFGE